MARQRLIAGAMSGTSADGVDVALVAIRGRGCHMQARLIVHHHQPYEPPLQREILRLRNDGSAKLSELAGLARRISLAYSVAVKECLRKASLAPADLACIAAHGQTLYHEPPLTLQWLDPSLLAAETGCTVVSDFRRADCAAGGQGAPLVPFADYILFHDSGRSRLVINIGGIANITYIPPSGGLEKVLAFDTGPGNCLSDWLCRHFEPDGPGIDAGGNRALQGRAVQAIVDRMLAAEFFRRRPPKSTDTPEMIQYFRSCIDTAMRELAMEDLLATACRITSESLLQAVRQWVPAPVQEAIVAGGGVSNRAIMQALERGLAGAKLLSSDVLGIPSQAREAIAFALLGAASLDGVPGNVPSATGARHPVVLGSITPGNCESQERSAEL